MGGPSVEINPSVPEPDLLTFIRNYWDKQRGPRAMPSRMDIMPWDMKAHVPHVLLADVIDGGKDFRYRLVGTQLQNYFSGNPTGKLMSEALASFGPDAIQRTILTYAKVAADKKPMRIRGAGAIYAQSAKFFDALLTPLSDDGKNVNIIFGAFVFEWDRKAEFRRGRDVDERELERLLHG
jgi:hypothetical protein